MPTIPRFTETPDFQTRLIAAYRKGGLIPNDGLIHRAAVTPATTLVSDAAVARKLVFALELYAALQGQPHPLLPVIEIDWMEWPQERWIAHLDRHALAALLHLSQSPFGAEFADDIHHLRPRLFRLAK